MFDNRKSRRYDLRLPLELVKAGGAPITTRGETRNVSSGGVLFASDTAVDVGQPIEYFISLPPMPNQPAVRIRCLGKVLRLAKGHTTRNGDLHRVEVAATMDRYEFIR